MLVTVVSQLDSLSNMRYTTAYYRHTPPTKLYSTLLPSISVSQSKTYLSLRSSNHPPTTVDTIDLTAGFSSNVRWAIWGRTLSTFFPSPPWITTPTVWTKNHFKMKYMYLQHQRPCCICCCLGENIRILQQLKIKWFLYNGYLQRNQADVVLKVLISSQKQLFLV